MRTNGSLWTCALLAACGSSQGAARPPTRAAAPEPEVGEAPRAVRDGSVRPMAGLRDPSVRPAPQIAAAELLSVEDGTPIGVVTFEQSPDGMILISGDFSGLGASTARAFYIHTFGSCADQGARVGGHFNPTRAKHGPPASSQRHAGDFGDLTADADGRARFSMHTDSITMEPRGPNTVVDRAIVIHVDQDSKRGDAGPAFACGVIRVVDGL